MKLSALITQLHDPANRRLCLSFVGWLLFFMALIAVFALCGCATPPTPRVFVLRETEIHCDSAENISALASMVDHKRMECDGFAFIDGVHVAWSGDYDIDGEPLPDFYVLGHEVWHKVKGDFHH